MIPLPRPLYLDYNASTPLAEPVIKAMTPFLSETFGNPSSSHAYGVEARWAVAKARGELAQLLDCERGEVIFTSGGTEANNLAIQGVMRAAGGGHVVTSGVEHPAVLEVCRALEREGLCELTVVGVDGRGMVDPADVAKAIRSDTHLITIMLANNEVGTLEPVAEIARLGRERGVLVHTDAAQGVGKIPINFPDLGVDLLSVAGHKMYAPKGVGALVRRQEVNLRPLMYGGGHEQGLRPGTENVLSIVGLGAAAAMASRDLDQEKVRVQGLRDKLEELLLGHIPWAGVHARKVPRLPNTLSISFPGTEASTLLTQIGDRLAASAGSACHAGQTEPSTVLTAMAVPYIQAIGTLRLSLGRLTTEEEVIQAAEIIAEAVSEGRGE